MNKQEVAAKNKSYRATHKAELATYEKGRQRERVAYNREWAQANPTRMLLRPAKERAKKLGLPFDLTSIDIVIPKFCPVLGIPLFKNNVSGPCDNSPTLDRIVPELGYIKGNVAVISNRANTIKSYGTIEEHRAIADWMEQQ